VVPFVDISEALPRRDARSISHLGRQSPSS